MASIKRVRSLGTAACAAWLVACASNTPAPEASSQGPAGDSTTSVTSADKAPAPVWTGVTEAEVAASIEKRFQEATRGWVKLKKDGVMMFCKRYRVIGSNIPTIQCITEAELRAQVENMDQYRDRMRSAAKCPDGPQLCSAL